jgi:GcrA cell cycle regulator
MVWNEETIRHLRDLWAEGHSTAEIGRRLGVSKNAIVGKAHRLDLDARPSPIRRDGPKPSAERPVSYPRVAGPTLPPLASTAIHSVASPGGGLPGAGSPMWGVAAAPARVSAVPAATVQPLRVVSPPPRPVAVPNGVPNGGPVASPVRPALAVPPVQTRRSAPACCWPIGEPGTKAFRFCDDTSLPGKPYCDEHAKLAYVRIRDRKEDAA